MKNYSDFIELVNEYYHYDDTLDYVIGQTVNRKELEEKIAHQVGAKIIWIHINPPEKFIIKIKK